MWGVIAVAAFFGFQVVGGDGTDQPQSQLEVSQQVDADASEALLNTEQSEEPVEAPSESPSFTDPESDGADAAVVGSSKTASTNAPSAGAASKIDRAMQQAFETGEPVRWEDGDLKGYAVPSSAEGSSGCRSVYYSIDNREGWQSDAKTICP